MSTQARAAIPSPETSLGDSFAWPFRDPEWFNKIVLMGLIGIIPIVGAHRHPGLSARKTRRFGITSRRTAA